MCVYIFIYACTYMYIYVYIWLCCFLLIDKQSLAHAIMAARMSDIFVGTITFCTCAKLVSLAPREW